MGAKVLLLWSAFPCDIAVLGQYNGEGEGAVEELGDKVAVGVEVIPVLPGVSQKLLQHMVEYHQEEYPIENLYTNSSNWGQSERSGGFILNILLN